MVKKKDQDDSSSPDKLEEVADELDQSSNLPRDKSKRKLYKIRNAGQGQVKIRGASK